MNIEIKCRYTSRVLFSFECGSVREAVIEAVKQGAYLRDANLGDAYLGGAYLRDANLGDAYLRGAYLRDANLGDAYLGGADLGDANLGDAYLRGANLGGANLRGADLGDAYLGGANLRDANLGDADLGDAYLGGANLGGANLGGANLRGADLRGICTNDKTQWPGGAVAKRPPVQLINALPWPVTFFGSHIQIGCKLLPAAEWATMSDEDVRSTMLADCSDPVAMRKQWLPILDAFRDHEAEAEFAAQQELAQAKGESNA